MNGARSILTVTCWRSYCAGGSSV